MIKLLLFILSVAFVDNSVCSFQHGEYPTPALVQFIKTFKGESSLTPECSQQLDLLEENLSSNDEDKWSIQMIDASGKVLPGIISGNYALLGNFDECLSIKAMNYDVKGKYCLASLDPSILQASYNNLNISLTIADNVDYDDESVIELQTPLLPSLAICIPHKCTRKDFKLILNQFSIPIGGANCQTSQDLSPPLDTGAIVTICYFGLFTLLMITGTIYDLYRNQESQPISLLLCFSVYTNTKRLLKTGRKPGDLSCLDGIRFLSMLWVIIGHNISQMQFGPIANIRDVLTYFVTTRSLLFSNGIYSVDTFFVVTGFLVVYSFMKSWYLKQKFNIIVFYLHRLIRLQFALIPAILASMYLIRYFGSGPFHTQINSYTEPCLKYWWSTLFFFSNYVEGALLCIPQTWYLNVDMQLYVLSPIFLLFLPNRPMIGLGMILCATVAVITSGFVITWHYKIIPSLTISNGTMQDFMTKYYIVTHTRATPWLIGALLGYVVSKMRFQYGLTHYKISKPMVFLIWAIIFTVIPVCIFASKDVVYVKHYSALESASYNAFGKLAWGVCIALMIFICATGNGGVIDKFLSLSVFQVLNRFTYSIYLVHLTIMIIISISRRQAYYFTMFEIVYSFWSIFALSFGVSIFWVLAFESPVPVIEKYLFNLILGCGSRESMVKNSTSTETIISSKSSRANVV